MAKITFIGAGNMAEAIIGGIIKSNIFKASEIYAVDVDSLRLKHLQDKYAISLSKDPEKSIKDADYILLAVKPQNLKEVIETYRSFLNKNQILFSILAGISIDKLKELLPLEQRPKICRVMPNLGAFTAKSVSALSFTKDFSEPEINFAENLFKSIGYAYRVAENKMDIVTAVSGSGPAYFFLFVEAFTEAAESLGMNKSEAFSFCLGTMEGAYAMLARQHSSPAELRKKVTSKGGTTAAALDFFAEHNFKDLLKGAVKAAKDRSIELGRQC